MKAIIIGGTGATGKEVVKQLLNDERWESITALVRRPYFEAHPRLIEVVVDFENLADYAEYIQGDVAFSCLGTTLKDAGSKQAQWRVDHDYPMAFARIAKAQHVPSFVLLSSMGANPQSRIFYSRMKGALEKAMQELGFDRLIIFQPGGIDRPQSTRRGEKFMISVLKGLNRVGLLRGYAPISTKALAGAMIRACFRFKNGVKFVPLKEIKQL